MFPAQTSFIPISVALARFLESGGGVFDKYSYWYLGSTPFNYLTGPVVPGILVGVHRVLPGLSLFDLSLAFVAVCQLLLAAGWGFLAAKLSGNRVMGVIGGIVVFIVPWHWVSAFGLGEVSAVLATALTPWALLIFSRFMIYDLRFKNILISAGAFSLLLLTNTTASIPAIFGMFILAFVLNKRWEEGIKKVTLVLVGGWLLSLWWYHPGFWVTTFLAPSIGGKSALGALASIANLLRGLVPLVFAVVVVLWGFRPKNNYQKFVFAWLVLFGSLTLVRFMADPKFWLDWTAWMGEVEVGVTLAVAAMINDSRLKINEFGTWRNLFTNHKSLILILLPLGWFWVLNNRDFWMPRKDITKTVEYRVAKFLENQRDKEPGRQMDVFLSGSTTFWLNGLVDVSQVRGGRDEASVDKEWREAAWEIRGGVDADKSLQLMRKLGITYLVVNGSQSQEFYHDFKYPEKFENLNNFEKVYDKGGDLIYLIK